MKRHPALRDLSSDHHQGLVQARRLVQAVDTASPTGDSPATVRARVAHEFLLFWSDQTTRHFREEEEVLLPAFARYGDASAEPVVRVLVEHTNIRRLVDDLQRQVEQNAPSAETMRAIGELLRGHIRHEEDVLFPLIETVMPEEELAALPGRLAAFDDHK
jgi:hemerythrin-like domain-containing protein